MWSGSLPTDLRPVPAPLNAIILRCFACRWGSAERAVVAFVPGGGGRLLLRPLHLRLPHAGLPLLQEGRHRLQGELAAAACWKWRGETNCVCMRKEAGDWLWSWLIKIVVIYRRLVQKNTPNKLIFYLFFSVPQNKVWISSWNTLGELFMTIFNILLVYFLIFFI